MIKKLTENWVLKLLSLAFALILWFFVMGEQRLERSYSIPLELTNMPSGMMVANEIPSSIDVRISGPRTLLMNLHQDDIGIAVDLKDLQPGLTTLKRLEERLNLPGPLKVTRLSPSYIDIKLERVMVRPVPVKVELVGNPAKGYKITQVKATPEKAVVEGARSELETVSAVPTELVDVTGRKEDFSAIVPLNYFGKYTHLKGQLTVEVRIAIEQRQ